jgi:hypothetical protein
MAATHLCSVDDLVLTKIIDKLSEIGFDSYLSFAMTCKRVWAMSVGAQSPNTRVRIDFMYGEHFTYRNGKLMNAEVVAIHKSNYNPQDTSFEPSGIGSRLVLTWKGLSSARDLVNYEKTRVDPRIGYKINAIYKFSEQIIVNRVKAPASAGLYNDVVRHIFHYSDFRTVEYFDWLAGPIGIGFILDKIMCKLKRLSINVDTRYPTYIRGDCPLMELHITINSGPPKLAAYPNYTHSEWFAENWINEMVSCYKPKKLTLFGPDSQPSTISNRCWTALKSFHEPIEIELINIKVIG